ncbi:MAG: hypothetical protein AAGU27_23425 [Dehalobacterium sp.]
MYSPKGSRKQDVNRGDFLDQAIKKENSENKHKNFMLYFIITIIIIYIAIPTYGIIRDFGPGEAVFVLNSPLSDLDMNRPVHGLIDWIHNFLFPSEEVPIPILQRIDLKGRVIYTDKTPYHNGIIELKSEPRYTGTDAEGYFIFVDVEAGAHTISVLDQAENVLARCFIEIERTIEVKDAELVRLPDGTLVFQVAVNVKVLEITLFLTKGEDGTITGIEKVELGITPAEMGGPLLPPVDPSEPPQNSIEPPENPTRPHHPRQPALFDFNVYDTATTTRYGRKNAVNVNIFGARKRIAPGMMGRYQFTVDNTGNEFPSRYDVTFTAVDTLPAPNKIPMRFRLKADGEYVAGNENTWCSLDELYQDTLIDGESDVKYMLEWHWVEGERDNDFAAFADNPQYSYSIMIKVSAQIQ